MNNRGTLVVALVAVVLVLAAVGVSGARAGSGPDSRNVVALAALAGLLAGGWHLYRTRSRTLDDRAPESGDEERPEGGVSGANQERSGPGTMAPAGRRPVSGPSPSDWRTGPGTTAADTPAPERTPDDRPLSGTRLAARTTEAAAAAREEESLVAGVETVRPLLRRTLGRVLAEDGYSRAAADRAMAAGEWTDDPVAAAVLDPAVPLPEQSLRERVRAWLFPDRVLRSYTRRATMEIAAVADQRLPPVPGQDAPRPVPATRTPVERLTRSVDGTLQESADPLAAPGDEQLPAPTEADVEEIHRRLGLLEEEES